MEEKGKGGGNGVQEGAQSRVRVRMAKATTP